MQSPTSPTSEKHRVYAEVYYGREIWMLSFLEESLPYLHRNQIYVQYTTTQCITDDLQPVVAGHDNVACNVGNFSTNISNSNKAKMVLVDGPQSPQNIVLNYTNNEVVYQKVLWNGWRTIKIVGITKQNLTLNDRTISKHLQRYIQWGNETGGFSLRAVLK